MAVILLKRQATKAHTADLVSGDTAEIPGKLVISGTATAGSEVLRVQGETQIEGTLHGPLDGSGLTIGVAGAGASTGSALQLGSFTTTQTGNLVGANGMLVYNSSTATIQAYYAGGWQTVFTPASPPTLTLSQVLANGATTGGTSGSHSITFSEADNIVFGTTTGTQIGTATNQKLSFYGATPVVQITGSTDVLAGLVTLGLRAASSNPPLNLGTGAITAGSVTSTTTLPLTAGVGSSSAGNLLSVVGGAGNGTNQAAGGVTADTGASTGNAQGTFQVLVPVIANSGSAANTTANVLSINGQGFVYAGRQNFTTVGNVQFTASQGGSSSGAGGNVTLTSGSAGTAGGATGVVNITGGAQSISSGSTAGGQVNITGGACSGTTSTGAGGAVVISGGLGGTTSGGGGNASLTGGDSRTSGVGGTVTINAGASAGANSGSGVTITAGAAGATSGTGGTLALAGGGSAAGNGGSITLTGGTAGVGTGGGITLTTGGGTTTGGTLTLQGGTATGGGTSFGGAMTIAGGSSGTGSNSQGGAINISGGISFATSGALPGAVSVTGGLVGTGGVGAGALVTIAGGNSRGTNQAAGGVNINTGNSSGTGAATITFQGASIGASGTGANTPSTILTLANSANGALSGTPTPVNFTITCQDNGNNSTTAVTCVSIAPTINYSSGTPSGSYIALKVAATETALPTGNNFLLQLLAGSAGTTQMLTVSNTGQMVGPSNTAFGITAGSLANTGQPLTLKAGSPTTSGGGGLTTLSGGPGNGNNQPAGGVTITTGASTGSGTSTILFKAPPTQSTAGATNTPATVAQFSKTNSGASATTGIYSFVQNATGGALATTAIDGFTYIGNCAGTPSGTPTSFTGATPLVVDTTNNVLYFYNSGWKNSTTVAPVTTVSTNTVLTTANYGILSNDASGNLTHTLPDLTTCRGAMFYISKRGSNAHTTTVNTSASQTIDGASSQVMSNQYSTMMVQAPDSGTDWVIL